jgi:hypothetical protein
MRIAHWIPKATSTHICFSWATNFTRTLFNVTLCYIACLWCGLTAHGELQQVDTAGHGKTGRMTCFKVLHKNANAAIFYAS